MQYAAKNIRTFIGAKDYEISRSFYKALDFEEIVIDDKMSHFLVNDNLGFYLQKYYVKDWIDNTMMFLEVDDIESCEKDLLSRNLVEKFKGVRISKIKYDEWGNEIFVHDPAGVLWHFCQFNKR